ncbi:MAG TPA: DegT/DnrJ/EryC1/StrS family aminotransferase [Acidimicrobiales bacterium]|nr:DegT/DnrJ/EryC1/StrS family aminotransferase [Acidimicrobiales bacterium]
MTPTDRGELPEIRFLDLAAQRERLGGRIEDAIARVLSHGQFIMGPEVAQLEGELARYSGVTDAVACSSGTDALVLALMAWDLGPGDAVFVPSFTFASTAEAVALLGAAPVFVDIDAVSFNMDPGSLSAAVEHARGAGLVPRAVIPVDLFGLPARYADIRAVAETVGMRVLADAAQSYGATEGGRRVGALADATCISFFPSKPFGAYGDGGAVLTDDPGLAERLRSVRVHGQGRDKYENIRVGLNARLDTIQAAVLLEKLTILDEELAARDRVASTYRTRLDHLVDNPTVPPDRTSAWAQYTIRSSGRDDLARVLAGKEVPTAVYYRNPLHLSPAYASFPRAPQGLPVTEEVAGQVLSLPMHPYLTDEAVDRIVDALEAAAADTAAS